MEPAGVLSLIVPGRLETWSGGYAYDRRILAGLSDRGWSVTVHTLDAGFPRPSPAARDRAARELAAIPDAALSSSTGSRSAPCQARSSVNTRV